MAAPFEEALRKAITSDNISLYQLSQNTPLLCVFLRHSGCTFCRETLAELEEHYEAITDRGVLPVLIHMGADSDAAKFFAEFGLDYAPRVSDPSRQLYKAFELRRASLLQLLRPGLWWRILVAGLIKGHGAGTVKGDGLQLSGSFLLYRGQILKSFRAALASDRLPLLEVSSCDIPASADSRG